MIAVIIPAFNVGRSIEQVLRELPVNVGAIIVVDDGSTDDTAAVVERVAREDGRIRLVQHDRNRGVGAAMVTGYRAALETPACVAVKVDGDGQMPIALLSTLLRPLVTGEADYAKGNRFRDFQSIRKMPAIRRFGNVVLSFLAKAATGYWHLFDPTNGFVAIRADVLRQVPLPRIAPSYFFEISMLCHLYLLGAVVKEVPMPARYNGEPSSLSVARVLREFPGRLIVATLRRIVLKNFVYDFSVQSLEIASGLILFLAGALHGGYNWVWYARHGIAAPTGTVMLPALLVMLGFQLLLSAVALDLQAVPREPINDGPITERVQI